MIHQSSTKCGSMLRFASGGGNKAMTWTHRSFSISGPS
jgi:hypothetical protein